MNDSSQNSRHEEYERQKDQIPKANFIWTNMEKCCAQHINV